MYIFKSFSGIFLFVALILGLVLMKEFLWETLVWNEHFSLNVIISESLLQFLVPLLVVPQFTHYLMDGFIWKKQKDYSRFFIEKK